MWNIDVDASLCSHALSSDLLIFANLRNKNTHASVPMEGYVCDVVSQICLVWVFLMFKLGDIVSVVKATERTDGHLATRHGDIVEIIP